MEGWTAPLFGLLLIVNILIAVAMIIWLFVVPRWIFRIMEALERMSPRTERTDRANEETAKIHRAADAYFQNFDAGQKK